MTKAVASRHWSALVKTFDWQHYRIAGTPVHPTLPSCHGNMDSGQVNDLGYGNNVLGWAIRSQAPKAALTGFYGEGSETKW
jgi:hypothetical protein